MRVFNREKTQELIKSLGGNIQIEDIDKYLQQRGVLVKVHIGRMRNYMEMNPKTFGINVKENNDLDTLFKDYVQNGKMSLIPKNVEKELINIEKKIRTERDKCALGYEREYMTIETYKKFVKFVEREKNKYFEKRDQICEDWDLYVARFKEKVEKGLETMNAIDRLSMYKQMVDKIPTKEQYYNSFYVELGTRIFPIAENVCLLDDDISEEIKKSTYNQSLSSVYEVIEDGLNSCFNLCNKVLKSYKNNEKIIHQTLKAVGDGVVRIRQRNLFKNELIDSISRDLEKICKNPNDDEIFSIAEMSLAKIYGYAEEIGVKIDLDNCELSPEILAVMYKSYQMEQMEKEYEEA